jgi:hypothetical protein
MKGKMTFTRDEVDQISRLIRKKVDSDKKTQQALRKKIRKLGFYASDFGLGGGYTEKDFLRVAKLKGEPVKVVSPSSNNNALKSEGSRSSEKKAIDTKNSGSKELMKTDNFKSAGTIDNLVPDRPGVYAIRIKDPKKLPGSFAAELVSRSHDLIYIGIASKSLKRRMLGQELRAKGHGTFFRSLGAVLGYTPPEGLLRTKKNKRNYSFSQQNERSIIEWINENLLVNWIERGEGFDELETMLIRDEKPLLNLAKNPLALTELSNLRATCVAIANKQL